MIGLSSFAAVALASGGPEISHSRGRKDGVVVLAPRIVPSGPDRAVDELAARLQKQVAARAEVVYGAPYVDVRPAPERVCPTVGCRAASIGLMIGHQGGGCVALGIVGAPGAVDQQLVPLAGQFEMAGDTLPFRTAPEGRVIIREFVPCGELERLITPEKLSEIVPDREMQ